jgi:hypothetical protein
MPDGVMERIMDTTVLPKTRTVITTPGPNAKTSGIGVKTGRVPETGTGYGY